MLYLDCTKYTPRYRISDTQGNLWPVKLVTVAQIMLLRGPMRKQHDLLRLMDMSSHLGSRSHACSNCSKYTTDGDINKMSSAYKLIIKHPICELHSLPMSSIYTANRNGDNTEPCLTPKSIPETHDHTLFHFTQEKQPESKFSNNSNKWCGPTVCPLVGFSASEVTTV